MAEMAAASSGHPCMYLLDFPEDSEDDQTGSEGDGTDSSWNEEQVMATEHDEQQEVNDAEA